MYTITVKKKWFYIASIVIASMLIVLGVVFLFVVNFNDNVPEAVTIFTSDDKTYIQSSLNDNTYGYIFRFKSQDNEIDIDTNRNILCVDALLDEDKIVLGTEYNISVQYKNEYENGYSDFSKGVNYVASKFLVAPVIAVEEGKITWESVEYADYYEVTYSAGNNMLTVTTVDLYLNFDKLVGGEHNFYVVAKSIEDCYLDSAKSNVVIAETYHVISRFVSATFNTQTKILTIIGKEDIDKIEVWIGSEDLNLKQYNFIFGSQKLFKKAMLSNQQYRFEIDLKFNYTSSVSMIKTKPHVEGYDVYNEGFTNVVFI